MSTNVRAVAAQVVADVLGGQSLNQAMPARLARIPDKDRAFAQQLCYGSLRRGPTLQALLQRLLNKPLKDKDLDVHSLLLLGLYQLEDTRVPDHAAVAATVEAVRALKKPWARGLTNAVLRRYQREREALLAQLNDAQRCAHPDWLHQQLLAQWPDAAAGIIEANNRQPPMTLRVNTLRCSRDEYLAALADAGIEARPGTVADSAIYLAQARDVQNLPHFEAGWVSVQDEAAQVAATLLQPAAGERVLDACAAPGGKSCHLLEQQPALAELVAMDSDAHRLQRVEENLERLGLQATAVCGDAAQPQQVLGEEPFHRILVDAPCSATGVIRRHPDIKLLRRANDIPQFAQQQLAILNGLWPLLHAGGTLLYATCSVLHEENGGVIAQFLETRSDASLSPIDVHWGEARGGGRQLLPSSAAHDGLYYARLQKAA